MTSLSGRLNGPVAQLLRRGEVHLAVQVLRARRLRSLHRDTPDTLELHIRGGNALLASRTLAIDLLTFEKVYASDVFPADCRSRVVLDVGAHKGYFGLWALAHGASGVLSYEPQSQNYTYLERTRDENSRKKDWFTFRAAVGRQVGTARLYVSQESWAHSMYSDLAGSTDFEEVEMTSLSDVLSFAADRWPGSRVVMKVNVEGAAADVFLSASAHEYASVESVHFDQEPGSPYDTGELINFLASAGLDKVTVQQGRYYLVQRTAPRAA
jgi:FkbM family methyltransferase